MIKSAMSAAGLEMLAVSGLLVFFAVFVGVCLWVMTRRRRDVDTWSSLPLADGTEPVQPRGDDSVSGHHHGKQHDGGGGCGKCESCSCVTDELITVTSLTMN